MKILNEVEMWNIDSCILGILHIESLQEMINISENDRKFGCLVLNKFQSSYWYVKPFMIKLDWVGPDDNRPSIDKLHQFVKKNKKKCDTWHATYDMWHVVGGEHSLKTSAP